MFIDEILTNDCLRKHELGREGHSNLAERIAVAQKFALTPDFVGAADALYVDKSQLYKALEFCELPYPVCWFEFSNSRRQQWVSEADPATLLPTQVHQSQIEKVGYLFEKVRSEDTWMISMFWKIRGNPVPSFTPYSVSLTRAQRTETYLKQPGNKVTNAIALWAKGFIDRSVYSLPKEIARTFHRGWQSDWDGELPFIFAMLGILNARNIAEREFVDREPLNRKRVRRGKTPLSSHYTLTINPRVRRYFSSRDKDSSASEMRAHFVRGHFKVRKSGVFFWSPHMRGDLSQGYVAKDYKVA